MRYVDYYEKGWLSELAFSPNKLTGGKMLREVYKVQNVSNSISKPGVIRMYKQMLSENKIKKDHTNHGAKLGAYNRLKKLLRS